VVVVTVAVAMVMGFACHPSCIASRTEALEGALVQPSHTLRLVLLHHAAFATCLRFDALTDYYGILVGHCVRRGEGDEGRGRGYTREGEGKDKVVVVVV